MDTTYHSAGAMNWSDRARCRLLRGLILPLGDRLWGQRMMKRLRFLEEAQYWPLERLRDLRDQKLSRLIETVYAEVPFYRDLMQTRHLRPADIRCPADLAKLPVITKAMLRSGYPDRVTRCTGQRTYDSRTSGSTGKALVIREDMQTHGWYKASFLLALQWAGWCFGQAHVQTGVEPDRDLKRRLKDAFFRCHYVSAFELADAKLDATLDRMQRDGIEHLWGYPTSLHFLARRAQQRGWNTPLRTIVTWGDTLYPHYRSTIETVFESRVTDTYGVCEGMQISAQCGHGRTYHVHMLDTIVEYLDEYDQRVEPDQSGDIVLTRLRAGPMPVIRYRVGDVGVAGKRYPCPCGRTLETMQHIEGRTTDVVLTPSGNRLVAQIFGHVLLSFPQVDEYQVVQDAGDSILVRLLPKGEITAEVRRRIVDTLHDVAADDLNIQIELVSEIPLPPTGKRRYVISELPQGQTYQPC